MQEYTQIFIVFCRHCRISYGGCFLRVYYGHRGDEKRGDSCQSLKNEEIVLDG